MVAVKGAEVEEAEKVREAERDTLLPARKSRMRQRAASREQEGAERRGEQCTDCSARLCAAVGLVSAAAL